MDKLPVQEQMAEFFRLDKILAKVNWGGSAQLRWVNSREAELTLHAG